MKVLPLLLAAAAAPPALAAQPEARQEVSLPDMNREDAIRSFKATGDETLYLEDREGRWYRARMSDRCSGLKKAKLLGFELGASLELSRWSAILIGEERCRIRSLTYSDPPRKIRKRKP